MLMYSRQSFHPIVSRDQYTTIVLIQRTLNIDPPIHRAVLYRPLYISVYRYIIPNVNPSIMLSGPFYTYMYEYMYVNIYVCMIHTVVSEVSK